jgi:hypothetical protein
VEFHESFTKSNDNLAYSIKPMQWMLYLANVIIRSIYNIPPLSGEFVEIDDAKKLEIVNNSRKVLTPGLSTFSTTSLLLPFNTAPCTCAKETRLI